MKNKIFGIFFLCSFGLATLAIFTMHDIDAQELSSNSSQTIPPSYQISQSGQHNKIIINSSYYIGDLEHPMKTYESYGDTVTVHPGESYVSTAECEHNDVLIGGGAYSNHEFSNLTRVDMPDGFQKDPKRWISDGILSQDIGKNIGNDLCRVKKWLVDGFVPQDGSTIEITPVAICATKK